MIGVHPGANRPGWSEERNDTMIEAILHTLGIRRHMFARCSVWGCVLPVGKGSQWGTGPICMVCAHRLRPAAIPPDSVRVEALQLLLEKERTRREQVEEDLELLNEWWAVQYSRTERGGLQ